MMSSLMRQLRNRPEREIAIGLAAFGAVALILFIAGAIMLGIGISKANYADELVQSCSVVPSTTTTTAVPTQPPAPCICPPVKPAEEPPVPMPYFLTLQTSLLSSDDLNNNYTKAVSQLQQMVQSALPDAPLVTVLSASPSTKQNVQQRAAAAPSKTTAAAIVAVIYTSNVNSSSEQIKTKLQQANAGISVGSVQDTSLPQNVTVQNQMCVQINTDPKRVSPPPPPPVQEIYPCSKFVTFLIDQSNTNTAGPYRRRFDFLKNTVLNDKWNHFERIGYGVFNRFINFKHFGTFNDHKDMTTQLDLDALTPQNKSSTLFTAFQSINDFYRPNYTLNSAVILFITQANERAVRSVLNIRLVPQVTLVTVGPTTGDSAKINLTALRQLNMPIIQWEDPSQDIPDWEHLFWKAYTCEGQPMPQPFHWLPNLIAEQPAQPNILPHHHLLQSMDYEVQPRRWSDFSGVLPLSSKSESEAENVPYTPCQKQIVIIYDCSNGISSSEFKKQLDFLSNKLLATNWNHFERLGLGFYGSSTLLNPFKLTNRADQLKKYIQFTSQSRRKASVNTLFGALALDEVYRQNRSLDVSTIVFISNASSKDIAAAQQYASTVNGFGQLTVVTLKPSSLSASAVTLLTSNVIEWDIGQKDEPDNWQQLFQAAYGCGGAITVQDKFVPCPTSKRQIVVAIDASNNLTAAEFQMEKSFLVNQVFSTNNWNHFERLGISAYAKFVSSRSFGILNSSEDMVNTINAITQQRKSPSLSTLLRDLNEKYPNNSTQPNAYIVFTSRAHPADVTQAVNDSLALASRGRLTFVALNGVDVDQLKRLSNNIIAWNMTTTSSPSDWQNAFMQAYNCDDPPPASSSTNSHTVATSV